MSEFTKDRPPEIYIEKVSNSGNESLRFEQEYKEGLKIIREIVDSQRKEKVIAKYSCNNRILFSGEQGYGKTSVLRSLAEYLITEDNPKDNEGKSYGVKFGCLPMVDPGYFDNNNNILLTMISLMFSEAKRRMEKLGDIESHFDREELLKQFERVVKIYNTEWLFYTRETLNYRSKTEELREQMNQLVNRFLTHQGYGNDSKLILLIVDIDMSVPHAFEMLEEMRKYMELDNLIILMTADLKQLSNEVRDKYIFAFQYTINNCNHVLSVDVEEMANKYLLKMFPTSRRVNVGRL